MTRVSEMASVSAADVQFGVQQGARFVRFQYCISVLILTFRRSSAVFYVRPGESRISLGLPYTLLSLFLGWWGLPWGLIYTPACLFTNLRGGEDVTAQIMDSIRLQARAPERELETAMVEKLQRLRSQGFLIGQCRDILVRQYELDSDLVDRVIAREGPRQPDLA